MTVSIVDCPRCHGRFNYEWSSSASWGSIPLGSRSIFRCPICRELGSFDLGNRGRDPALPTTNDMKAGVGGRTWGLLLGPFLVGVILAMALTASPFSQLFWAPILGGVAWLLGSIYYLNRRLGK